MEKYLTHLYLRVLARLALWKENTRQWLFRHQYKLFFLAFLVLMVYNKDLQLTIGFDGYPVADFRAIRPLPRLMGQQHSLLPKEKEDGGEASISWDYLFREEAAAKPAPAGKAAEPEVKLPAPRSDKHRQQLDYVRRFARVARIEMEKYGIPASVTLAQGLLESDAGRSRLASKHNNHFGIKCHSRNCPKGHCVNYHDDSPKDFFRQYPTAWESFRAHSIFLTRERYQSLHKLKRTDYKGWAKGLEKAGYATGAGYGEKLIRLIEDLQLQQYDQ